MVSRNEHNVVNQLYFSKFFFFKNIDTSEHQDNNTGDKRGRIIQNEKYKIII